MLKTQTAHQTSIVMARYSPGFVTSVDHPSQMEPGAWKILSVKTCAVVGGVDLARVMMTALEIFTAEICLKNFTYSMFISIIYKLGGCPAFLLIVHPPNQMVKSVWKARSARILAALVSAQNVPRILTAKMESFAEISPLYIFTSKD